MRDGCYGLMKTVGVVVVFLTLAACEKSPPADTVDSLAANPERLNDVQRLCKDDPGKVGDAECAAASEAYRRRFMGVGKTKYTSRP